MRHPLQPLKLEKPETKMKSAYIERRLTTTTSVSDRTKGDVKQGTMTETRTYIITMNIRDRTRKIDISISDT